MKSKTAALGLALPVLLVLDAGLRLTAGRPTEPPRPKAPVFSAEEIVEIELGKSGLPQVRMVLKGPEWFLTAPFNDLADSAYAADLLTSLGSMPVDRVDEAKPEKLSAFGLDPASAFSVTIKDRGGRPHSLLFGRVLPLDVLYVYASFEGDPSVYKVLKSYRDRVEKGLASAREPKPFPRPLGEVRAIRLTGAFDFSAVREDGVWKRTGGAKTGNDDLTAKRLLEVFAKCRAMSFKDRPIQGLDTTEIFEIILEYSQSVRAAAAFFRSGGNRTSAVTEGRSSAMVFDFDVFAAIKAILGPTGE